MLLFIHIGPCKDAHHVCVVHAHKHHYVDGPKEAMSSVQTYLGKESRRMTIISSVASAELRANVSTCFAVQVGESEESMG